MKTKNSSPILANVFSFQLLVKLVIIFGSLEACILLLKPLSLVLAELSSFIFLIPVLLASFLLNIEFSILVFAFIELINIWLLNSLVPNFNLLIFGLTFSIMFLVDISVSYLSTELRKAKQVIKLKSKTEDFLTESIKNSEEFEKEIKKENDSISAKVEEETKELEEERSRLEASINSLNVGFIITNTKNEIVNLNSTAKRLLCITEAKSTNSDGIILDPLAFSLKCDLDTISKQLDGKFDLKKNLETAFKERKIVDVGNIDFRDLVLHIFMSPIVMLKDSALKVIGTVILVEDVTKEKILERSRDEFFSIASHELRTPLTSIKGNTALIKQYYADTLKGDKNLTEMVDDIHESSVRLIEIVNDFLDTSRLEQGRISFNKQEFNFKPLVDEVIKEMSSLALQKNLYLKFSIEADDLSVVADRDRTKQVLINFVGNSLKFTETGGVSITLENDDDFLKVLVTDTGRGIDQKNQKLLFHKFQQASSSLLTRDTAKGTGLGLYISKLMIEGMGGAIGLEKSLPGKGATFMFTLPLVKKIAENQKVVSEQITTTK